MAARFLAVADIHSRRGALRAIREETARHAPDAVIVAGDLTNSGDAAEVRRVLESILDDAGGGRHIGFSTHLEALQPLQPRVLLCGHCHESPGVEVHCATTVVNCSLGRGGRGALVEMDGDRVTARLL